MRIILHSMDDLVGQASAVAYALTLERPPDGIFLIERGEKLYAVKYNKSSISVWIQN